jgi:hypothetical protein
MYSMIIYSFFLMNLFYLHLSVASSVKICAHVVAYELCDTKKKHTFFSCRLNLNLPTMCATLSSVSSARKWPPSLLW